MSRFASLIATLTLLMSGVSVGCAQGDKATSKNASEKTVPVQIDSVAPGEADPNRYTHLTEADFRKVAAELNVEVAAIKAVVSIEAGSAMKGFWAPGVPVINFDRTMYNKYAPKANSKAGNKNAKVPSGLKGYALQQWTQLVNARKVNEQGANLGTFWGMFQIGGFNYKLCGCETIQEFVDLMSYSELEQLELFASFIKNAGMLNDLRLKSWSAFARKYNGPSYAKRGYHTKMANAYAKFKAEETKNKGNEKSGDAKLTGTSLKVQEEK